MKNGLIIDNGEKRWFKNDKLHREDGPAVIYPNGTRYWYFEGRVHREDGPAIERSDGGGTTAWYLHNVYYGQRKPENWNELVKQIDVKIFMES